MNFKTLAEVVECDKYVLTNFVVNKLLADPEVKEVNLNGDGNLLGYTDTQDNKHSTPATTSLTGADNEVDNFIKDVHEQIRGLETLDFIDGRIQLGMSPGSLKRQMDIIKTK